jgi:hypothetical protein
VADQSSSDLCKAVPNFATAYYCGPVSIWAYVLLGGRERRDENRILYRRRGFRRVRPAASREMVEAMSAVSKTNMGATTKPRVHEARH